MKTHIIAAATAMTLGLGALTPATAQTMGEGFNMLTGIIYNELVQRDIPTDNIRDLSLAQLAQIKAILEGEESESKKTDRIKAIMAQMQ